MTKKTVAQLLERRVADGIGVDHLYDRLERGESLRVKLGIDPTSPDLHIGHIVPVLLLRSFQQMGHTAVLVIGDYTARIGDPSGRDTTRPPLSADDVAANAETYLDQLRPVLDIDAAEVRHQQTWYKNFTLADVIELLSSTTVSQILEHNTFKERLEEEQPFVMHEALYPLLQAYDSVAVEADVEIGAMDQLFNIGLGRTVQKFYGQEPQDALLTPYILGTDGRKMSKTFDNTVNLTDSAGNMYGKLMSIPDDLIVPYTRLLTDLPIDTTKEKVQGGGTDARDAKAEAAAAIVALFHGEEEAQQAAEAFTAVFAENETPSEPNDLEVSFSEGVRDTADVVAAAPDVGSKSEAKRLVEQGGVRINDTVVGREAEMKDGDIMAIGKHRFYRLRFKE